MREIASNYPDDIAKLDAQHKAGNYDPARCSVVFPDAEFEVTFGKHHRISNPDYTILENKIIHFDHLEQAWGGKATLVVNNNGNELTGQSFIGERVEISFGIGDTSGWQYSGNKWIDVAYMWVVGHHHVSGQDQNEVVITMVDRVEMMKYEWLMRTVTRFDWQRNMDGSDQRKHMEEYFRACMADPGMNNQFMDWSGEAPADHWEEIDYQDDTIDGLYFWNHGEGVSDNGRVTPAWTYGYNEKTTRFEMFKTIMDSTTALHRFEADRKLHIIKVPPYSYWDWDNGVYVEKEYDKVYEIGDGHHQWYYRTMFANAVIPSSITLHPANMNTQAASGGNGISAVQHLYIGDLDSDQEAKRMVNQLMDVAENKAYGGFLVCMMDLMIEVHDRIRIIDHRTNSEDDGYVQSVRRVVESGDFRCEVTYGECPAIIMNPLLRLVKFKSSDEYTELDGFVQKTDSTPSEAVPTGVKGDTDVENEETFVYVGSSVSRGDPLAMASGEEGYAMGIGSAALGKHGRLVMALEDQTNGMCRVLLKGKVQCAFGDAGADVICDVTAGDFRLASAVTSGAYWFKAGTMISSTVMMFNPSNEWYKAYSGGGGG